MISKNILITGLIAIIAIFIIGIAYLQFNKNETNQLTQQNEAAVQTSTTKSENVVAHDKLEENNKFNLLHDTISKKLAALKRDDEPLVFNYDGIHVVLDSTDRQTDSFLETLTLKEILEKDGQYIVKLKDITECSGTHIQNKYITLLDNDIKNFDHVIFYADHINTLTDEIQKKFAELPINDADPVCGYVDWEKANSADIEAVITLFKNQYQQEDVKKIKEIIIGLNKFKQEDLIEIPEETQEKGSSTMLTKDYLVSGNWGQEELDYGMQIKFNSDGTFDEYFAGESGDLSVFGSFEIHGNSVNLKVEKYANLPFDEAKELYGSNAVQISDRTLILKESTSSLFFTHYLGTDSSVSYWNRSSKVPEGKKRQFKSYTLITTQEDLKPRKDATVKSRPLAGSPIYSFASCDPSCDPGTPQALSEIYKRVLARTQSKDMVSGVRDYWYLVNINVPWYSVARLNNESILVSLAWMHGSELE